MESNKLSTDEKTILKHLLSRAISNSQYGIKDVMATGLFEYADESILNLLKHDLKDDLFRIFFNSGSHLRYIGTKELPLKQISAEIVNHTQFEDDYIDGQKTNPIMSYSVYADHTTPTDDMYQLVEGGKPQFNADGTPIMLIKDTATAFKGFCRVEADRNGSIGGIGSMDYRSELLGDPKWVDLYFVAAWQCAKTRDFRFTKMTGAHHIRTEKLKDGCLIKIIVLTFRD